MVVRSISRENRSQKAGRLLGLNSSLLSLWSRSGHQKLIAASEKEEVALYERLFVPWPRSRRLTG